jgi:acyl-[acyl carrier protein]--UDP-N-acetylglucosamine O-acyltransferase
VVTRLRHAYRYLLLSKLNTTRALATIENDPELQCAEVQYLVDFIRGSKRGVILRRASRRLEDVSPDE